jgi:indolepyruvate ferredoxin oxidoreductase
VGAEGVRFLDATRLATAVCGDAIATNMFLLGYAWQLGLVPLSEAAIVRAVEINGAAVVMNTDAFRWGRLAAHDLPLVESAAAEAAPGELPRPLAKTLDEVIALRETWLVAYQDRRYAQRYRDLVERVRRVERERVPTSTALTEAVARGYHKLLAYKDEYEVARLHANGEFRKKIEGMFEGDYKTFFYLAPPLLAKVDPATGEPRKMRFGAWMLPVFRLLAKGKGLRGGAWDVFGYTRERKLERQMIADYEKLLDGIWVFNGSFELVDSWIAESGNRNTVKFRLLRVDGPREVTTGESLRHDRVIPSSVKLEVWKRDQGRCVQCGSVDNLHFDHIIPFSRGGSSLVADNIQILCARHNLEKRDHIA